LENAIERAATLCEGDTIRAGDLPPSLIAAVKTTNPSLENEETIILPPLPDSALYPLRPVVEPNSNSTPAHEDAATQPVQPLKSLPKCISRTRRLSANNGKVR